MHFTTPFRGRTASPRAGRKIVAVAMASAMATMMVPAAAFAHYAPENTTGRALLIDQSNDSWGNTIKKTVNEDGSVSYTGIAHSDLAHYAAYGLTTTIKTDSNKKITAIDITSGDETYSGSWGYMRGDAHGKQTVEGYLPDGVNFQASLESDGTYSLHLTGAAKYGSATVTAPSGSGVVAYSADASGATEIENGAVYDEATDKVTINDASVNLVKVVYKIGAEAIYFNTYFTIGEEGSAGEAAADAYLDTVEPTQWISNPDISGTIGDTNRDRWATIMATEYQQRVLQSWGAFIENDSLTTEIDDLDTISGATKTSEPFVNSLNQAVLDGYVTGVAEDVVVTVDGKHYSANANPKDQSTVSVNSEGKYVLTNIFPEGEQAGGRGTSLSKIEVYSTGTKLTTAEVQAMSKGRSKYEATEYTATSLKLNPKEGTDRQGNPTTSYSWADFETDLISFDMEDGTVKRTITALDSSVNAVALTYTIGHATITVAYDLEQMKAAGDVKAQIESLSNEPSEIIAARAAYNALNTDVRGFVTNIDKLKSAEAGLTLSKAKVTLSKKSYTYTGSAAKPGVTVKIGNTTLVNGTDYTVKYTNNVKVGTATATVTGKGAYSGSAKATFSIAKASQKIKVATAQKSVKASKAKKKAQTTSKVKVTGAKTTVSYSKAGGSKKLSINKKTGKITVKKGTKKGIYTIKVKATAAANANYKAATKTVTVKVKVK